MILRKCFSLLLAIVISSAIYAQNSGKATIAGIIADGKSQSVVEFATVEILNLIDSTVIASTVTDAKGQFSFPMVENGKYLLRYSFIGYSTELKNFTASDQPVNLGRLLIFNAENTLNTVTVSATKSLITTAIDRKSYDVTKDIMAQSGTVGDVLRNIPSVEVDIEGNLSLRGAGNVMILVNGRPSPLFGKVNQAEALQQFPANSIERIEVITNPSARYRPDGTSGIINIVLKKNIKRGVNGAISGNIGNRSRYNANANINYNTGKLNLFGSYGFRKDARIRTNKVDRIYFDSSSFQTKSFYKENLYSLARPLTNLATVGFTFSPDSANSFGISGNYSNRTQLKRDVNTKMFYGVDQVHTSYFDRLRIDPEKELETDATLFYEHQFPGEDHSIRVEVNVSKSKDQESNHYENRYFLPTTGSTYDNTLIFQGDKQQTINIDYVRALSENSSLEAGYAGTFNQQDFNFYGEYFDQNTGSFVKDAVKTNRFLFNQDIHALYMTYQKKYHRFGYTFGLRLEESLIKGHQTTKDTVINNNYLKLYPTLHLAYQLKGKNQLQLNYSRRIHRPEGDDINPFPEYQDPYNIRAGNASLLPEIIHSVELGYRWQNSVFSFTPSLYYRYKQNGFTQVTVPLSDSVFLTTQQNLLNDKSAGLELIVSAKTGKFMTTNLSSNFFYNQIEAANLGYFGKRNVIAFNTNLNTTLQVSGNTMIQISATVYSARLTPQGKKYPAFVFNTGIRQDFLKKKMSVLLTASDIFRTMWQKTQLSSPYFDQVGISRRDGQIVYLGLSYRFGKTLKKTDNEMQFE